MKKKEIYEATIEKSVFPDTGIAEVEGRKVSIKHCLPGQKVRFVVTRARQSGVKGNFLELLDRSPEEVESACPHSEQCGGCCYRTLPYEKQMILLEEQIHEILEPVVPKEAFLPIRRSPISEEYRNKMELTFGDEIKDGPLVLGLHKRGSFYDITPVNDCLIMDADFRAVVSETQFFFREKGTPYYHRRRHDGILRHLLVRKGKKTGEILLDLITTSAYDPVLLEQWAERIKGLSLEGKIAGILHTVNDGVADTIANEGTEILYGKDWFTDELLGLQFRITPFSFFQTNTLAAEVLYDTAREFIGDLSGQNVFDLYSGTGTIAQVLAPVCEHVTGVEIVEEAVVAARENAVRNQIENCTFLAGDVLKVLDEIPEKPDTIVLDPPRDGVNPKALKKIIDYGVDTILYISCKPTSLARDLVMLKEAGYEVKKCVPIDLFPYVAHCETCALLTKSSKA